MRSQFSLPPHSMHRARRRRAGICCWLHSLHPLRRRLCWHMLLAPFIALPPLRSPIWLQGHDCVDVTIAVAAASSNLVSASSAALTAASSSAAAAALTNSAWLPIWLPPPHRSSARSNGAYGSRLSRAARTTRSLSPQVLTPLLRSHTALSLSRPHEASPCLALTLPYCVSLSHCLTVSRSHTASPCLTLTLPHRVSLCRLLNCSSSRC